MDMERENKKSGRLFQMVGASRKRTGARKHCRALIRNLFAMFIRPVSSFKPGE